VTLVWSFDRRVAMSAFVAAGFALAIPLALADTPVTRPATSDRLGLARELAALANRGTAATWLVTFAFTRANTAGRQLHETLVVARRGSLEVDDGLGSLIVTAGARTYSCTDVGNQPQCLSDVSVGGTSKPGDVYGGAVVSGRYAISRGPSANIAGLDARCYSLRLLNGVPISGLGYSSEQCYSSDGIPLQSRIVRAGGTDERVALTVRRTVGRNDLLPVLAPYGLGGLAPAR
jgi:hypothetical protein